MRKFVITTILILVAFLCALWSPWNNWDFSVLNLFGVDSPDDFGGLQVTSLVGELEVFVEGESMGKVDPESSPLTVPGIEPGDLRVKLVRTSPTENAYWDFNQIIEFIPDVDVVISYELGPDQDYAEGHIISAGGNQPGIDGVLLNIDSDVVEAKLFLDDLPIGSVPLLGYNLSTDRQHKLRVEADGYDSQEFTLLPAAQEERDKLKGLELNVYADLFLQPIRVE